MLVKFDEHLFWYLKVRISGHNIIMKLDIKCQNYQAKVEWLHAKTCYMILAQFDIVNGSMTNNFANESLLIHFD